MSDLAPVLDRLDADADAALERLFALMRLKSVSTDPAHAAECRKAADWLADELSGLGFEARVVATDGQPLVIGHGGEGAPHLLFYGHYDVQPVDPLELWDRDPFDPAVVTGEDGARRIVGRGASDDKGQLMTFLEACRAHLAAHGRLPCRVSVVLEGEEESGGDSLARFLETDGEELRADIAAVCDTTMWDARTPALTTMLRGMVSEEVTVRGPSRDLHSGFYGGAAANPIHVLADVLAALRGPDGRIRVPGFYDGVPELPGDQRAQWAALGFDPAAFLGAVGLSEPAGESGRSVLEALWARPTAEVNGIVGGYTGAGFKTVIPSEAHAKVSFRLVGDQDPRAVRAAFRAFVEDRLPGDCGATFHAHGASPAITMPTEAPAFAAARRALEAEWGRAPALIGAGGSIPIVSAFKRRLGMDTMLIGFALEDDRIHAPNEKYDLASFTRGARSWARILSALAG